MTDLHAATVRTIPLLIALLPVATVEIAAQGSASGATSARAAALGGANTAMLAIPRAGANPASTAAHSGRSVSVFAAQLYGLSELRLTAASYVEVLRYASIAVGARTFGFDQFRETQFGLTVARGFRFGTARQFHVGIDGSVTSVSISEHGSATALGLSGGWIAAVTPGLSFGFHAVNLNSPAFGAGAELPRSLALGVEYVPVPKVIIVLDAYKDVRFPTSFRGGLEVRLDTSLFLRTGFGTQPTRFTAGAGVQVGRLVGDLAVERHVVLGWSEAASISVQW